MLQGLTSVPDDWYINCTPGAKFSHIKQEIMGVGIPPGVENVIVICGTNYENETHSLDKDLRHLYGKICILSPPGVKV